jgi:uncharacterized protein involved in response to NO
MPLTSRPLWLVGFRPFFALACVSGLSLPLIWIALFTGKLQLAPASFSIIQWHAHEMFFGFGWAVMGGFLLTSTKNWVHVRGYHGAPLLFLAAAWLFERAGMWWAAHWPPLLFQLSSHLFMVSIVALLLWTLLRHRREDTFKWDNTYFLVVLPAFLVAKHLLLSPAHFQLGISVTTGLFRMAFLVMLERTLTQFMKGVYQVQILRNPLLDNAIKALGLLLIFERLLPPPLSGCVALLLAVLLLVRFGFWKPQLALRRLDLGIMYLGYLAIAAQLIIVFLDQVLHPAWVGTVSVHVFTFGVMGLIIPAMLVRIFKGHTGRKVQFDPADKRVLQVMMLGFAFRIVAPQLAPARYLLWLWLAAACWFICFSLLAWRYVPYVLKPRVDGKEH